MTVICTYQSKVAFPNKLGRYTGWAWGQGSHDEGDGPWGKLVEEWADPDEGHSQTWTSPEKKRVPLYYNAIGEWCYWSSMSHTRLNETQSVLSGSPFREKAT